jgi:hypothetical protein
MPRWGSPRRWNQQGGRAGIPGGTQPPAISLWRSCWTIHPWEGPQGAGAPAAGAHRYRLYPWLTKVFRNMRCTAAGAGSTMHTAAGAGSTMHTAAGLLLLTSSPSMLVTAMPLPPLTVRSAGCIICRVCGGKWRWLSGASSCSSTRLPCLLVISSSRCSCRGQVEGSGAGAAGAEVAACAHHARASASVPQLQAVK